MTDSTEKAQGAGESGQPEAEQPETQVPAEPDANGASRTTVFRSLLSRDLERTGLLVFLVTACATVIFIFIVHHYSVNPNADIFTSLKLIEKLLTLTAAALVVALIGRAQNPLVLAFGIFLIGALIVPSSDIIRFALIAFGSDKNYEEFITSSKIGRDPLGRSSDAANKIVTELESNGYLLATLEPSMRKRAVNSVISMLVEEREITLLEQVRTRGAFGVLRATSEGDEIRRMVYEFGSSEDDFRTHLNFLRSSALITFNYDDLSSVEITELGRQVLHRAIQLERAIRGEGRDDHVANLDDMCPEGAEGLADEYEAARKDGVARTFGDNPTWIRLGIPADGTYLIEVDNAVNPDVDPYALLISMGPDNQCRWVAEDDDSGGDFRPRISQGLVAGNYLLGLWSLNTNGTGTVRISDPGAPE